MIMSLAGNDDDNGNEAGNDYNNALQCNDAGNDDDNGIDAGNDDDNTGNDDDDNESYGHCPICGHLLHFAHHCTVECISLHFAHHLHCTSLQFVPHCTSEFISLHSITAQYNAVERYRSADNYQH